MTKHNTIRVQGARENNLKNINTTIPKHKLTVFTGVSGSGKSSLVFGTIAAESQRLINETYSAFLQGFMPNVTRPEVDVLEGLTTAIIVDQERMGANSRSTVGTATDANSMLRILFSQIGKPHIGSPQAFAFNIASSENFPATGGMCPNCEGMGKINDIDLKKLYDDSKSLNAGALTIPGYTANGWGVRIFTGSGLIDPDKAIRNYTEEELHNFLYHKPIKVKIGDINMTYEGLIPKVKKAFLSKDRAAMQPHIRAFVDKAVTFTNCPACAGTRLNENARSCHINNTNIAEACSMEISDLANWASNIKEPSVKPLLNNLQNILDSFVEIGLGYLSLDRPSGSLSGGEAQRTKMIRHLASPLTDISYIFDEPTIGLHPHDIEHMNKLLLKLRDKGNTVLVVEHKPETIAIADNIIDLGPAAGSRGGNVCFEGTVAQLSTSDTVTGKHLNYRASLKKKVRKAVGTLEISNATAHNLKNVNVDIPLGILVVITGVAGSGKSSLIHKSMPFNEKIVSVDQTAIRGSRRSNPATYTKLLDPIRKAFAKANSVEAALFSANSTGACPNCNGAGVIYTDLGIMASAATVCQLCEGKRFHESVLKYRLAGKNISEVLEMSVVEAEKFFSTGAAKTPAAKTILTKLVDVGLGYISLGQPLSTLSGGERQRLKLANSMADKANIYILDEPTTGLHLADVANFLNMLDRLVDSGKSVIVIEHNQAVMAHADWIIDIGPGAGNAGGEIVFTGTPTDLISKKSTLTAKHLAAYVAV